MAASQIAIASVFETPIGRPLGLTPIEMMVEAALGALSQVGLTPGEVDACFTSPVGPHSHPHLNTQLSANFSEYLGLQAAQHQFTANKGGGALLAGFELASSMIRTGEVQTVLWVGGGAIPQSAPPMSPQERQYAAQSSMNTDFSFPYGLTLAGIYAMIAQRHMHEFGTTPEQVAQVIATAHEWGRLAGTAGHRPGLTVDDVLASPMVVSPYHELELLSFVDGCAACVITSADHGRELNPRAPVVLGLALEDRYLDISQADTLAANVALASAAERAYEMAGLGPSDIDMFANYDAFPMTQIIALEALGFAAPGEGGRFVQDGHTAPGGSMPTSTNGGMMVQGHPTLSGALYSVAEACRQLEGRAEGRQLDDCQVALHATYVGSSGMAGVVILGNEA